MELIACCRSEIAFIKFDSYKKNFDIQRRKIKNISIVTCFEMKNNSYIISGETGVYHLIDYSYNMDKINSNEIGSSIKKLSTRKSGKLN